MPVKKHIHVWHLEIREPETSDRRNRGYRLERVGQPTPEFARYLYVAVGAKWLWYMRYRWDRSEWQSRMEQAEVDLWVAYAGGQPAGYFELEQQPLGSVEICYFGLVPAFIGKGMGRDLLEDAISCAVAAGAKRVWLHTCTLDHENALANYKARGFRVFREENVIEDVPDSLEPWPGSG